MANPFVRALQSLPLLLLPSLSYGQDVRTAQPPQGEVLFSPSGRHILTTSGQLFDLKTGRIALDLNDVGPDNNGVPTEFAGAFSQSGKYLLFNRRVFDAATLKEVRALGPNKGCSSPACRGEDAALLSHKDLSFAGAFSGDDSTVLAGEDILDLATGRTVATLKRTRYGSGAAYLFAAENGLGYSSGSDSLFKGVALAPSNVMSPDGRYLLARDRDDDRTIVFGAITPATAKTPRTGRVVGKDTLGASFDEKAVSFSANGDFAAVTTESDLRVYNLASGKWVFKLDNERGIDIESAALSFFGKRLLVVGMQKLRVYDVAQRTLVASIDRRERRSAAALSPDGSYIIEAPLGEVLSVASGEVVGRLSLHKLVSSSAHLTPSHLAIIDYSDGSSRVFDARDGHERFVSIIDDPQTLLFVASSDGRFAAASDWQGHLTLWNTASDTPLRRVTTRDNRPITQLVFDAPRDELLSLDFSGTLTTWSLPSLDPVGTVTVADRYNGLALAGADLVAWVRTKSGLEALLLDRKTGQPKKRFSLPASAAAPVFFGPSQLLFAGLGLFNYERGTKLLGFDVKSEGASSYDPVTYVGAPSDHRLTTITKGGKISQWDLSMGRVQNQAFAAEAPAENVSRFDTPVPLASPHQVLSYGNSRLYDLRAKTSRPVFDLAMKTIGTRALGRAGEQFSASPDGTKVAIIYDKAGQTRLGIFSSGDGKELSVVTVPKEARPRRVVFGPGDKVYFCAGRPADKQQLLGVADGGTGKILGQLEFNGFDINGLTVAEGGQWLAFGDGWDHIGVANSNLSEVIFESALPTVIVNRYYTSSPDGRYLAITEVDTYGGGKAIVLDLQTRSWKKLAGEHYFVAFSADSRHVLSTLSDSKAGADFLTAWRLPALTEKTVTMAQLGAAHQSVLMTPDKFYMASKEVVAQIHFSKGPDTYLFDQFDLRFNRPDIVLSRLGYTSPEALKAYRRAWEKRVTKMGFDPSAFDGQTVTINTPELRLSAPLPLSTTSSPLSVALSASDREQPLVRLQIYQNGVPIFGRKGLAIKSDKKKGGPHKVDIAQNITLMPGRNVLEFSVLNRQGVESLRERAEVNYAAAMQKPNLYVVAIGVSEFQDRAMNLTYAAKDADDLASLLKTKTDLYDKISVQTFTNARATRANILAAKAELRRSKQNDEVIIFAASHGLLDDRLDYYIATHDMDFGRPAAKGLKYEELEDLLDGIPALHKLSLIDACHSGEVDKEDTVLTGSSARASIAGVSSRGFKGVANKAGIGLKNSFELMQELFADLRRGTGAIVISSASGKEFAFESEAWHNGVFTYALLEGMKTGNADANKDHRVVISELRDYVVKRVEELTRGLQNPTSRTGFSEHDFQVY